MPPDDHDDNFKSSDNVVAFPSKDDLAEVERLAALDPIQYDRERKDAANRLDCRKSTLDERVAAKRAERPAIKGPSLRRLADCTVYRKQLPQNVQDTLNEHEAAGTVLSEAYQDAVMVFYKRHLCRCDPWPWEIERSFEIFNYDLYRAMWGSAEFTATGVLKDYDGDLRLHQIEAPALYTCGELDEATPAA